MSYRQPTPRILSWDTYPHEFVSVASLALRWCESPHAIRKWIRAGKMDSYRFGHRSIRVTTKSAMEFEARMRVAKDAIVRTA